MSAAVRTLSSKACCRVASRSAFAASAASRAAVSAATCSFSCLARLATLHRSNQVSLLSFAWPAARFIYQALLSHQTGKLLAARNTVFPRATAGPIGGSTHLSLRSASALLSDCATAASTSTRRVLAVSASSRASASCSSVSTSCAVASDRPCCASASWSSAASSAAAALLPSASSSVRRACTQSAADGQPQQSHKDYVELVITLRRSCAESTHVMELSVLILVS